MAPEAAICPRLPARTGLAVAESRTPGRVLSRRFQKQAGIALHKKTSLPGKRLCTVDRNGSLKDPTKPRHFREAGHFWGIAPGTPKETVRSRIRNVDATLAGALALLDAKEVNVISSSHGKALFEREDIQRCMQFHGVLKTRFIKDLRVLDPTFEVAQSNHKA